MYSCHDCKCCPVRLISCRQHATRGIYWTRQRKNSPDPTISFHVCFRVFNCVTLLFLTVTKNDYYLAVVALWQPLDSFSTWANGHCFSLMLLFHREHRPSVFVQFLFVTRYLDNSIIMFLFISLRPPFGQFFVGLPSCSPAHLDMYHVPSHLSPAFSRRV